MPTISNPLISASLDESWPKIFRLERHDTAGHLAASGPDIPISLEINGRIFDQSCLVSALTGLEADSATYQVSIPEWHMDIFFRFALEGQELVFTIPEVQEHGPVLLERLRIIDHRLVSGLATAGDSFFRHGTRRLNWSREWCPGTATISHFEDWGTVVGATPEYGPHFAYHTAVWNEKVCAAFWCSIHIEPLSVELSGQGGTLANRAGRYSVSAGTWYYRLRGTLAEPFELRVALLADYNGDGKIDWADAAGWEGDRTYRFEPLYHEAIIYKIWLDSLFLPKPNFVYADILPIIQRLHRISGGLKQIIHLFGWQGLGHDTLFPCHNEFNPRLGTREDLVRLIEQAREWNCCVSLHANFDDSYPGHPEYDPTLLSRDPDGPKVWFFNTIVNAPTYSISHTLANESGYNDYRIKQMMENLPLRESIHLDAHRPYNEVWLEDGTFISAECEVQRGMIPIRDKFTRVGLDLSIEGRASEKRGLYTWCWILPSLQEPYLTLMTHGRFPGVWRGGMNRDCAVTRVEGHALGISNAQLSEPIQDEAGVTACFYLDWMYAEILRRKKMTGYRLGDWEIGIDATYEDNTRITAGHSGGPVEAWYEGIPMARGGDRFLPWREDTIYLYSRDGGAQEWTLPESWGTHDLSITTLTPEGETSGPAFNRTDRTISLEAPAGIPLRLTRV
ncbi:MAG: endo-alpha-N-acetylgalactosaminidase family protein [Chthoniobacteraceae bacterium]